MSSSRMRFMRAKTSITGAGKRAAGKPRAGAATDDGDVVLCGELCDARNVFGGIWGKRRGQDGLFRRSRRTHKEEDPRAGKERKRGRGVLRIRERGQGSWGAGIGA